jgi:uncharacterized BrkB/YihY/UPF0761 family membrane protein
MGGLYWAALPSHARRATPLAPGAVLAVGLQLATGSGWRFYLRELGGGGAYESGLAALALTVAAIFFCCVSVVIGEAFNYLLGVRRRALLEARRDRHLARRRPLGWSET